jgi:SAM-dependent methyltransferase
VTGFSAEWLALREPADARARDAELCAQLAQLARGAHAHSPSRFIDLACGTGANVRYLAPRVGGDQQWLLVDNDVALLDRARSALPHRAGGDSLVPVDDVRADDAVRGRVGATPREGACRAEVAGCRIEARSLDLATELHTLDFAHGVVVTASALLDLVSHEWLAQLVEQCRANRCTALFALSYAGRIALTPSDPDDEWIRQLVNRHQLGDKGFGPALGPAASRRASSLFSEAGYHVRTARSDWNLLPTEHLLQGALLEGWANAAAELAPGEADRCKRWLTRRLAHVANESSRIRVGHEDVLAWPQEANSSEPAVPPKP